MTTAILDGNVTDQNEAPVAGALVYVYDPLGGLADLTDSMGQAVTNPVTADEDGYWSAYALTDRFYTLKYYWGGRERRIEANVLLGTSAIITDPNFRGVAEYATKTEAAAATYLWTTGDTFRTSAGVTAGDGGAAQWKVVASQPTHPGKIALSGGKWGEILGPYLPVEAFGAVGDCPDVSVYNPATQQTTIAAAVTGATNDIQAFQDAFKTAKAIGGATVTYGHGKRYRIGFNHLGVFALVMGDNTTLQRVGGGWLEFDPSLLSGEHPTYSGFDARRAWPDPGLCAGDPVTGWEQSVAITANSGNVVPASEGVVAADFTYNVHTLDVDIRCHTRAFWHALADVTTPGPTYRRLRMFGIKLRSVIGASVRGCFVKGMPNDGYYIQGRDINVDGCTAEACGYGSVNGTSCNSFSVIGLQYVGLPLFSAEAVTFTNCTSRFARDEGFAKAGINSLFVRNFTSIGDHDRAVEGISGYKNSLSSGTVGEPISGDSLIDGVLQDGKHQFGTATTTAGSTTVSVSDAFWLGVDTPGSGLLDRYIFIPGAGAAASAGPFRITAVNYVANTITVADDVALPKPTNGVTGVAAYVMARCGATISDSNEMRTTLRGLKLRNLYCTVHALQIVTTNAGRHLIEDAELENVTIPTGFHGVSLNGERVTADNIRAINCAGGTNSGFISTVATKAIIRNCRADAGFAYGFRAFQFSGAADEWIATNNVIRGTQLSAIKLDFTVKCSLVEIVGNKFLGVNSLASATDSFIFLSTPASFTCDDLEVQGNVLRGAGRIQVTMLTGGTSLTAASIQRGRAVNNDLYDPDFISMGATAARFYANSGGAFNQWTENNNGLPGQRITGVSVIPPVAGRFSFGDEIRMEYPTAGSAGAARCTAGGNYATLKAADGATAVTVNGAVASSLTVVVSDSTNIKPNDTLLFAGSFTRVIYWVDHSTHTLTLSAALTASDAATVANVTPTFVTVTNLITVLTGSKTFDPPSVAAQVSGVPGVQSTTVTVTGAALGDPVVASFSLSLGGLRLEAEVTSASTVTVYFINTTAGAIDLGSGTLLVRKL